MTAPTVKLSEREASILRLVAEGSQNGAIAKVLFLSEHTIKSHVTRLLRKLGARDRAHAVHLGHKLGFLGAPATPSRPPAPVPRPTATAPQLRSALAPPLPRTDLSDRHLVDCDLFRIRYCDCVDRRQAVLTPVQEGHGAA